MRVRHRRQRAYPALTSVSIYSSRFEADQPTNPSSFPSTSRQAQESYRKAARAKRRRSTAREPADNGGAKGLAVGSNDLPRVQFAPAEPPFNAFKSRRRNCSSASSPDVLQRVDRDGTPRFARIRDDEDLVVCIRHPIEHQENVRSIDASHDLHRARPT
jgi:hypothetical protein